MPKPRTDMEKIREILRLCIELNMSIRKAAKVVGISKTTVGEYIAEFKRSGLAYANIAQVDDSKLFALFENGNKSTNPKYETLSKHFHYYEQELKRPGVTLYLLWEEYKETDKEGFSYSRFCHHYTMWKNKHKPSMHIEHKAGDKMYIDFTGKKMSIIDSKTGEIQKTEIFVAILGASQLTYVEASYSQGKEDWIRLNENALTYFGGVPLSIVPDNLKSAVTKACNYEPLINETYYDFARHYNTIILPTRPAKPKDKSLVENAVSITYQRIFARLRNITFFSLQELNEAIWKELEKHNNTFFQKRQISRRGLFEQVEKQELQPLPVGRYELKEFEVLKVEFNYHIYIKEDKHYYSVPWQYVGKKVKLIYSASVVEIYKDNIRIALHKRNRRNYGYTTRKEHMKPEHQFVNGWDPDRFIKWASTMGGPVKEFIKLMLDSREHPEQAFKACMGILRLEKKYDINALQIVCKRAIELNVISYRFINNSLKNKTYKMEEENTNELTHPFHKNIRGKEYYK